MISKIEEQTVSVTIWGDGLVKKRWSDWYLDMSNIFHQLGYARTHIGIVSENYKKTKLLTVMRKEKEVLNQLNDGVEPTSLSLYSLPNQYKTATFDYNILVVRQDKYISVIVNKSDFEKLDLTNLIDTLVKYIEFDSGEVYMMNRNEVPLIYASKANAKETFK